MTDIVLDHIFYEKHGQQHTDSRINQEEDIIGSAIEPRYEMMMEILYHRLQKNSCKPACNTDKEGEKHDHITLRHLHQQPSERRQHVLYEKPRPHSLFAIIQR